MNPLDAADRTVDATKAAWVAAVQARDSLRAVALEVAAGECPHLRKGPYRQSFTAPDAWRCPDCGAEGV